MKNTITKFFKNIIIKYKIFKSKESIDLNSIIPLTQEEKDRLLNNENRIEDLINVEIYYVKEGVKDIPVNIINNELFNKYTNFLSSTNSFKDIRFVNIENNKFYNYEYLNKHYRDIFNITRKEQKGYLNIDSNIPNYIPIEYLVKTVIESFDNSYTNTVVLKNVFKQRDQHEKIEVTIITKFKQLAKNLS